MSFFFQNGILITVVASGTLMNFENTVTATYATIISIKIISMFTPKNIFKSMGSKTPYFLGDVF